MSRRATKNKPPAGKTLVEVAIVIALLNVALMLSATTLVALFRVERQVRASDAHRQTIARLSSRWRQDVHMAISADSTDGCRLSLPDGRTIQYSIAPPEIVREVRRGDEVLHRDAFILAARAPARFDVREEPTGQFVSLTIESPPLPRRRHQTDVRPLTLIAAVNLHGATSEKPTGQEAAP
jgi:hypothetical protein